MSTTKRGATRNQPVYTLAQERLLTRMLDRASRPTKLAGTAEKSTGLRLVVDGLILVTDNEARLTEKGREVAERLARGERIEHKVQVQP